MCVVLEARLTSSLARRLIQATSEAIQRGCRQTSPATISLTTHARGTNTQLYLLRRACNRSHATCSAHLPIVHQSASCLSQEFPLLPQAPVLLVVQPGFRLVDLLDGSRSGLTQHLSIRSLHLRRQISPPRSRRDDRGKCRFGCRSVDSERRLWPV